MKGLKKLGLAIVGKLKRAAARRRWDREFNASDPSLSIRQAATRGEAIYREYQLVRHDEAGFWIRSQDHAPICITYQMFIAICEGLSRDNDFPAETCMPEVEGVRLREEVRRLADAVYHEAYSHT